jgi:two-component system CheB/CheR fusion protein
MARQTGRSTRRIPTERRPPAAGARRSLVVGIGASAGALEALERFFARVPPDSGASFVVVQHLERHHPSVLTELLGHYTRMPVLQAMDGDRPRPDHVHVIPPNAVLTLERGVFRLATPAETGLRSPVDEFFRSLAVDQGEAAVGIIVSGTGSDGTRGLRAIKEHGGLTLAQAPETARYESMPESAIAAGLVDAALPVEEMPERVQAYALHFKDLQRGKAEQFDAEVALHLPPICEILLKHTGHDFSRYKEGTLVRRIGRRVRIQNAMSVADYVRHLEREPAEAAALVRDLSIGVTHFFRDPEAFEALAESCLPAILDGGDPTAPTRIWVPGCASGEEAYSLAILAREHLLRRQAMRHVQIFATDIDADLVAAARAGRYSGEIRQHLSPERLERFFSPEETGFRVSRDLRDMCTFSVHSLVKDPPFSSLDLISCRNVLIYLGTDLQRKLVPLFHFALRPGGYLFLGASEGLAAHEAFFTRVDRHERFFRRNDVAIRPPEFPLTSHPIPRGAPRPQPAKGALPVQPAMLSEALERMLREEYAPPCVVVNQRGDVLYVSGRTSRYLQSREGVPTNNVLDQANPALRLELRTALTTAVNTRRPAVRRNVSIETGGSPRRLDLTVRPLPGLPAEAGLDALLLQENEAAAEIDADGEAPGAATTDGEYLVIEQLEDELRTTRADLQASAEELVTSNEELKSANEELISANEEMQSANEELQSSREELQTVNDELREKVRALDIAQSDLQNHYASSRIATIFLDRDLRITRFTPAATTLFHLIEGDVGRPIGDLALRIRHEGLLADAQAALRTERGVERYLPTTEDDRWFLLRILPYQTLGGAIAGVGLTFVDVTALTLAKVATRDVQQHLATIVDSIADGFYTVDRDWRFTHVNEQALRHFQRTRQELIGRRLTDAFPALEGGYALGRLRRAMETGEPAHFEADSTVAARVMEAHAYPSTEGLTVLFRDVTERNRMTAALRAAHDRSAWLARLPEENPSPVLRVAADGIVSYCNPAAATSPGWRCEAGKRLPPPLERIVEQAMAAGREQHDDVHLADKFYGISVVPFVADGYANLYGLDISERLLAEDALRESEERHRLLIEHAVSAVAVHEIVLDAANQPVDVICLSANPAFEAHTGLRVDDVLGRPASEVLPGIARSAIMKIFGKVALTGEPVTFEQFFEPLNRYYLTSAFRVGEKRFATVFSDITERVRAEQSLREVDRRKDEFLAVLSHELRNPLTPIRHSLHILDRAIPGGEEALRARAVIGRQVSHLTSLVDDLLDVTRITRGKVQIRRLRVDLVTVVRQTVEDHRTLFEGREVFVGLPAEPIWIDGDETRLSQAVGNLLNNAAKFTSPGGAISVALTRTPECAVLEVADTGSGIDPDMLGRLFEPFAQADGGLDRPRGGLGLGLALVKGMVELHGGQVTANSDGEGRGARFSITLPLYAGEESQPGAGPAARPGVPRRRVLVIEDNQDAADSLREALELDGHEVAVAYDGQTGLAKARDFSPEIVLCDIGLPGMDGYGVARAFRADAALAGIRLVALTGYVGPEDLQRARDAGFVRHVAKPPSIEELEQVFEDVCGGR